MLIGNGRLIDKIPMTFLGRDWNGQLQAGSLPACTSTDNFGSKAALPNGYYNPHGWMLPRKGGNLVANNLSGSGTATATAQSGKNIDATITGSGGIPSTVAIGLIVSIVAGITGSGGVNSATATALANMLATITGSSTVTATGKGLADLTAALVGVGTIAANNTALMSVSATIRGYGDLTPEGIRDTVWSAILANYPNSGTAGNTLALAGSGGVDYQALGEAVWAILLADANLAGSMGEFVQNIAGGGGSAPTAAENADAVRTELAAELAQLTKVSKIHGVGVPLVVTATSRVAGDLSQTISTAGDTTTVSAA